MHAFISIHESIRYNFSHTNYINLTNFCVVTMSLICKIKTKVIKYLIDAILIKLCKIIFYAIFFLLECFHSKFFNKNKVFLRSFI